MSPMLDLLIKFSMAFGLCAICYLIQIDDSSTRDNLSHEQVSKSLDTSWRYTSIGWQDSNNWVERTRFPKPIAAKVHPFVWTALIVLVSLGLLIWAADEVDSLASDSEKTPSPLRRHRCKCKPRCKNFCLQELIPNTSLAYSEE